VLLTAFALAFAVTAAPARAGYLAAFSGNTQPYHTVPGNGVGGTINFAVYDALGGVGASGPTDTWGTGVANFNNLFVAGSGSGALSTTSRYLYLFQVVNNGPSSASFPISTQTTSAIPALISSFGSFTGTSFGPTSAPFVLGVPSGFGDPSAASVPATPAITGGVAGLIAPGSLILGSTSLKALFTTELTSGQSSTIYGFTSNVAPSVFSSAGLIDGGTTADGRAPTAIPEPSAIVLGLIGLPFGLLLRRRLARD
jgi:hypothetical protein